MGKLSGKVALVTGGNSGIGFAAAQAFAAEGAQVIVTGRRADAVAEAAAKIGSMATGLVADVANLGDLRALFETVQKKFGHIDVLFANAGIAEFLPVDLVNEDHFDRQFNTNVKGLFFTVQYALPLLRDGGSIILNASVVNHKGFAGTSVYSATKAAVRSFARTWANDLKERKIRVNAISPGPIETPIFDKMGLSGGEKAEMAAGLASQVPLNRLGQPTEIAAAAVFLAANDSSYVNGIDLSVDGGIGQV